QLNRGYDVDHGLSNSGQGEARHLRFGLGLSQRRRSVAFSCACRFYAMGIYVVIVACSMAPSAIVLRSMWPGPGTSSHSVQFHIAASLLGAPAATGLYGPPATRTGI